MVESKTIREIKLQTLVRMEDALMLKKLASEQNRSVSNLLYAMIREMLGNDGNDTKTQ